MLHPPEALGIEGAEQTGPDMAQIQPEISVEISGTSVRLEWGWAGQKNFLDMCEIEVDRGVAKASSCSLTIRPRVTPIHRLSRLHR